LLIDAVLTRFEKIQFIMLVHSYILFVNIYRFLEFYGMINLWCIYLYWTVDPLMNGLEEFSE